MNTFMMVLAYTREHPAVILMLTALISIGIMTLMMFTHNAKMVDAVTSKPLSLTAEQAKQVAMRHKLRPAKYAFLIPAALATDETINTWADAIAPRLGTGFQPVEVTIIPQKLWIPARYRVTFARLEALR
uniref:hypothetical protein n=1 Tax=uncultured Scardovia sp. TaxID=655654 RepID=UPI00374F2973